VSKKEKEEERARQKKEEAREESARRALDPLVPPKGAGWIGVLRREEDMEEELSHAPLEDIVARMVEQSATIYKIANCSNGMKGSLVGEMRKVVAMVRAATTVLAGRARENEEMGSRKELERYRKEVERLRAEIREMKETRQPAAPTSESPLSSWKRNRGVKRRRANRYESNSEGEEMDISLRLDDKKAFPPLPPHSLPPWDSQPPQEPSPYIRGPAHKGGARYIDAHSASPRKNAGNSTRS